MATAYVLGLICVLSFAQAGLISDNHAIIEDLRSADPSWRASRIVNGWPAETAQIPYQGSLRMVGPTGGVSSCGCSLIHNKWVITAAHCVANRFTFVVRFGLTNLTRPEIIMETGNKYIHPRYIEATAGVQTDDIALIGLDRALEYSSTIQPSRLQSSKQKDINYSGVPLVVSGYGRTDDHWNGGVASEILLWVLQRGLSNEECLTFYPNSRVIKEQTICAGYYNVTNQSSCQGDSGGPLTVVDKDGERTQVGIVSFGHARGCAAPIPSGYVRPGYYHDWYLEVTGINFDWDSDAGSGEEDDSTSEENDSTSEENDSTSEENDSTSEENDSTSEENDSTPEETENGVDRVIVVDE